MKSLKIAGNKRETKGSKESKNLRKEGKVPGIIYGGKGENLLVTFVEAELRKILSQKPEILEVEVDKGVEKVRIREIQMDTFAEHILHLDLQRA